MNELSPKEALERMENDPKVDPRFLSGVKEIVMKQATFYPNKKPIVRFYDLGEGTIKIEMEEGFRRTLNRLMEEGKI